jgi:6-phosphogluconolactonase (cycloisomerase 2 family)
MDRDLIHSVLSRGCVLCTFVLFASLLLIAAPSAPAGTSGPTFVYVGAYTTAQIAGNHLNPNGLSVFRFDPATGALSLVQEVRSANPSWAVLDPSRRFLYVINEVADYEGKKSGSAEAWAIDPKTGRIHLLNHQSLNSPIPSQLAIDPAGRHLVVSSFIGGEYIVLPIGADGRLGPVSGRVESAYIAPGSSPQAESRPHSVVFDPSGRFIATANIATDKIQTYRLTGGSLERVSEASLPPGTGPRHIAFDLSGKHLYVISQPAATVTVFAFDPAQGQIGKVLQTISTVPDDYKGSRSGAEIAVHPSGNFLYASTRETNIVVGYRIDPSTGLLSVVGFVTEGISTPRSFAFDPSGKWLYVENQTGDTIVQFEIDPNTGQLKPTGRITPDIAPVVMLFRPTD